MGMNAFGVYYEFMGGHKYYCAEHNVYHDNDRGCPLCLNDGIDTTIIPGKSPDAFEEAYTIINGERQDVYGNPEDSFADIADYWTVYLQHKFKDRHREDLRIKLDNKDIAIMMTLFKLAREEHQHKRDNIVDALGYLKIYADRLIKKEE
jgi:hypothetical protein